EPTLRYMAPDFNYAAYKLSGIKDFIVSGEKAGYFKLAEDSKGSYLVPGRKAPSAPGFGGAMTDDKSWMARTMDAMLRAERADQLADIVQASDVLSAAFEAFLDAESKDIPQYWVRGKLQRIRDFLKICREQGIAKGQAAWQISRVTF